MRKIIPALFFSLLLFSCRILSIPEHYALATKLVREAAFTYAKKYVELAAEYSWGGQDPLPKIIRVDCSGLVVRCYQYVCNDFGYHLPFSDMNAAGMEQYCENVTPETGDLIFMGDDGLISHVALFDRIENGNVYFIDATSITGIVSERNYPISSSKIIKYGRMYLYH